MKSLFIFFIFFVLFVANISATSISPASLTFNLQLNEKDCQTIRLESDSETIIVSNQWAENPSIEWKLDLFNTKTDEHHLSLSYQKELAQNEREVEVCLAGSQEGEYHGAIIFQEEQQGNSILRLGVWIKAIIGNPPSTQTTSNSNSGEKTTSSSSSSNIAYQDKKVSLEKTQELDLSETDKKENEEKPLTTVTSSEEKSEIKWIWLTILAITIIAIVIALIIWKRKKRLEYY